MRRVLALLLSLLSPFGAEASAAPDLHGRVMAVYTFLPRNLDQAGLERKSAELDQFWSEVKNSGSAGLSSLRAELVRSDLPVFFNYDGAKLLLSLSTDREDKAIALASISRADLRDLQLTDYFRTVHSLAVEGLDTSEAAFKILGEDKFQAYIPQHALTLDQELCLLFMLIPTDEGYYLSKAEARLFGPGSVTAKKSLLTLLATTVTKQGDAAVRRFAEDAQQPQEARDYAKVILEATSAMASQAVAGISLSSYETLKAEQRALYSRVSDEALYELQPLRVKLRRKGPR